MSDGTIYCCSSANPVPLPKDPLSIENDEEWSKAILDNLGELSAKHMGSENGAQCVTKQACYLPNTHDGYPLIGAITAHVNAFVGAGHTCWGILNGPITGKVLAEMMFHGGIVHSLPNRDLAAFNPSRAL